MVRPASWQVWASPRTCHLPPSPVATTTTLTRRHLDRASRAERSLISPSPMSLLLPLPLPLLPHPKPCHPIRSATIPQNAVISPKRNNPQNAVISIEAHRAQWRDPRISPSLLPLPLPLLLPPQACHPDRRRSAAQTQWRDLLLTATMPNRSKPRNPGNSPHRPPPVVSSDHRPSSLFICNHR